MGDSRCLNRLARLAAVVCTIPVAASSLRAQVPEHAGDTIQSLMRAAEIPGLSIAVVRARDIIWSGAFGVASTETREPVTEATVFEAASLSKPVFAYAVLRMVERGELDLDQPLWELHPYPRLEHDPRARLITARMVLTHTTGLPNWGGTPLEIQHDPGSRWSYSGEGFVYLQRSLEARTGLGLDELARREAFGPLGMNRSGYVWRAAYDTLAATGHDMVGAPVDKRKPEDGNAAASLHTTAVDYARFLAAVLGGDGISQETRNTLLEASVAVRDWESGDIVPRLHWALGWGAQEGDAGTAIWHWGDNGSFRCFVIGYPERGDGLVYFTNSENGLAIAEDLVSLFHPDTHHAVRYLDYRRYDDPRWIVRVQLRRGFRAGVEEGRAAYDRLAARHADVVRDEMGDLVGYLIDRDQPQTAVAAATLAVRSAPEAAAPLIHLGSAYTAARRYDEALESYRSALELGAEDPANLEARIDWLRLGLDAESNTAAPSAEELRRYAGDYGPRHVRMRNGELYYERDGSTSSTRLTPLGDGVFALESSAVFRIRFVTGDDGRITKIIGLYADGRTDETPRSN